MKLPDLPDLNAIRKDKQMPVRTSPVHILAIILATSAPAFSALAGTLTTLYSFSGGPDGAVPNSAVIVGPARSLIGTTEFGGSAENYSGYGTVYQLMPPAKGQTFWTLNSLHIFSGGSDGGGPNGLVADTAGNIYGVTSFGGIFDGKCVSNGTDYGCGTVYEISPPAKGQTDWQFTTLYGFTGGGDGFGPSGALAIDASGSLYGTTGSGGNFDSSCMPFGVANGCGTVFKLSPPGAGQTAWTKTILYSFANSGDGYTPSAPLIFGADGTIFGNTFFGGDTSGADCSAQGGCGTIYQLSPPKSGSGNWSKKVVLLMKGANGSNPWGGLSMDENGNIFGGAQTGGKLSGCDNSPYQGCGIAFELSPTPHGKKAWTSETLYKFTNGSDGSVPWDPPILFGKSYYQTTSGDEVTDFGSIVELTAPVPGKTKWKEKTVFSFTNDVNGSNPWSTLLPSDGLLFGTASGYGTGPGFSGTVFSYKP